MVNVIVGISKIQCFSRSMPDVTCQRMPILADKLVIKMKEEIKANPVLAPGIFMNYYYQTYSKFNFIQHKQRRKFYVWSYMENTKMNP